MCSVSAMKTLGLVQYLRLQSKSGQNTFVTVQCNVHNGELCKVLLRYDNYLKYFRVRGNHHRASKWRSLKLQSSLVSALYFHGNAFVLPRSQCTLHKCSFHDTALPCPSPSLSLGVGCFSPADPSAFPGFCPSVPFLSYFVTSPR